MKIFCVIVTVRGSFGAINCIFFYISCAGPTEAAKLGRKTFIVFSDARHFIDIEPESE